MPLRCRCITWIIHQQLWGYWGYKVEEELHLGIREQKAWMPLLYTWRNCCSRDTLGLHSGHSGFEFRLGHTHYPHWLLRGCLQSPGKFLDFTSFVPLQLPFQIFSRLSSIHHWTYVHALSIKFRDCVCKRRNIFSRNYPVFTQAEILNEPRNFMDRGCSQLPDALQCLRTERAVKLFLQRTYWHRGAEIALQWDVQFRSLLWKLSRDVQELCSLSSSSFISKGKTQWFARA
jgi:hypothetical protein